MNAKSILLLAFLIAGSGAPASAAEPGERTLVLFGASWCLPCRVELQSLPALAEAAAPDRVIVAWVDRRPPAGTERVAANVAVLAPDEARSRFDRVGGDSLGVPVTTMFARKRLCGLLRQPATVAAIRKLQADC